MTLWKVGLRSKRPYLGSLDDSFSILSILLAGALTLWLKLTLWAYFCAFITKQNWSLKNGRCVKQTNLWRAEKESKDLVPNEGILFSQGMNLWWIKHVQKRAQECKQSLIAPKTDLILTYDVAFISTAIISVNTCCKQHVTAQAHTPLHYFLLSEHARWMHAFTSE